MLSAEQIMALLRSGRPEDHDALRDAGVVRGKSAKQIAGDYAEYLVARHFDGTLARRNNRSFDVTAALGRISVKARSLDANYYRHFTVRQEPTPDFDHLVLVELAPDWTVACSRLIAWEDIPVIRDYLYAPPSGGTYSRFYRSGKWRTQAVAVPLR